MRIPKNCPLPNAKTLLLAAVQPMFAPEDCDLAEEIAKSSPQVQEALKERHGVTDMTCIAANPWSVHLANQHDVAMAFAENGPPRWLVQTFLCQRVEGDHLEDNHCAHPIDVLPVVGLNTHAVVHVNGLDCLLAPKAAQDSANCHRDLLKTSSCLQSVAIRCSQGTPRDSTGRSFLYSQG
jgi:primary-amine oxidase